MMTAAVKTGSGARLSAAPAAAVPVQHVLLRGHHPAPCLPLLPATAPALLQQLTVTTGGRLLQHQRSPRCALAG
jgi:hypothetical protein